jgi:hypothetical protein
MSNRPHLFFFALSLALFGCDGDLNPGPDASTGIDAALADGGGLLDGGRGDASAASDAGIDASRSCDTPEGCDPRSPDGCPSEGRCVLVSATSSCEPTAGSLGPDDSCMYATDCAPGLACFDTPSGGRCGRICCPGDETCVDGATCGGSGVLIDGTETHWGRCLAPRRCDVLSPSDTCEMREGCYIVDSGGNTECRVAGTGQADSPCAVQEDCESGFFCGGIGATRCVRICRIDAEDCPDDEGRCIAQAHSPAGTGFCTTDSTTLRRE